MDSILEFTNTWYFIGCMLFSIPLLLFIALVVIFVIVLKTWAGTRLVPCPHCAEMIQPRAVFCKHCQRDI